MQDKRIDMVCQAGGASDALGLKVAACKFEPYIPDDIVRFIEKLTADPRFAYIHLIAMTAGDIFGSNFNGDIFDEDELLGMQPADEALRNPGELRGISIPRYKTFETAKFFTHHNHKETSPFYGDVPCAAWNDKVRRVELVVRIAREPIPELGMRSGEDIIGDYERRGFMPVSMGTRIRKERCTACGAENVFPKDRCYHLKFQMGQIRPDGVKVAARNYGMRFFDISKVLIGADPDALPLAKVASLVGLPPALCTSELGAGDPLWVQKLSAMLKRIDLQPGSLGVIQPTARTTKAIRELTPEQVGAVAKAANRDLSAVLATFTLAAVPLSPLELLAISGACEPAKAASLQDILLDKFHRGVYDAARQVLLERSGYVAPMPAAEWEPAKIAEQRPGALASYYGLYRALINALPQESFEKAAHFSSARELHLDDRARLNAGMASLVYAGRSHP